MTVGERIKMLSTQELERYRRQLILNNFGEEAQQKLKRARIVIAGAGGLGSPALIYLAAAGVGTIRLIDSDAVELSNLNRQILHWTNDIGKLKVLSAAEKLTQLNPEVMIETIHERIGQDNLQEMASGFDLILDAVDNLETRYLLNKFAVAQKIPFIHGAVSGLEGRALTIVPGRSACLMCLYRGATLSGKPPVIGVTPGIIACIQATEAIKYLTGLGRLLQDRLLIYDGLNMSFNEIKVTRDTHCLHCGAAAAKG
jgi:molybdopterin/thiamine biosynthesis adenylyltransferase